MNRIYKFDEFVSIFESEETVDNFETEKVIDRELLNSLKKFFNEFSIERWINCPEFGGIYTRPFNSYGYEIFYKWKDEEYSFENVLYKNGEFYAKENPKMMISQKKNFSEFIDRVWRPIENMIYASEKEEFEFNPFEHGVENMPIIKNLESKGMEIVSSPKERKNGTLVLRFPDSNYDYVILRSGYIKRKNSKFPISTDREELLRIIKKLEDLIPKIAYVYYLYIKDKTKSMEIPKKSIEKIISLLSYKEVDNNPIYKEEYDKMVQEYPIMTLYLPDPEGRRMKN